MPSPKRIFRNATIEQIEAAYAAALDRVTNGAFTSLSGGGTSSTKQYANDQDIMFEAQFELDVRNGVSNPSRTTQDFSELREHNVTV